ncbi:hypothetical protein I4U23_030844 [Adineta vaga]|nr:hypothetical protein I4U23_030844 [Adineta vaga]
MEILASNSSWEFPQLIVGDMSMINDSCGRNYPWYGSKNQVVTIQGSLCQPTEYTISMRDLFAPWIPWDIPTCESEQCCLTHIYRHQRFYVWLCAMNCTKNELLIVRTLRWTQKIEINVQPDLEQGKRATLISNPQPNQPILLKRNLLIPSCALQEPSTKKTSEFLISDAKTTFSIFDFFYFVVISTLVYIISFYHDY